MRSIRRSHRRLPGKSRLSIAVGALALVASAGACASSKPATSPFDQSPRTATEVQIVAQNNEFADATLYSTGLGERRKLGVIVGKTQATFRVPWRNSGPMQIEIVLLAGGTCTTPSIQVDPGDVLELQITTGSVQSGQCAGARGGR